MPNNFEQALAAAKKIGQNARVKTTLATNQDNGLVSYATGDLFYSPSFLLPEKYQLIHIPESLNTGDNPLNYLFSDREINIAPPPPPGTFNVPQEQPFSVKNEDQLGITIHNNMSEIIATFTLVTWGNALYHVVMKPIGDLLYGFLSPAVFTISFQDVYAFQAPK